MRPRILSVVGAVALAACGAGNDANDFSAGNDAGAAGPECFSSNECPTGWTCSEFGTCVAPRPGGDAGVGPEEIEVELSPPVSSERYVYVAMTELDALAKIDGETLEVSSVSVGDQPTVLEAIPGSDGVVVLDSNNGTATIVRAVGTDTDTRVVPTLANMNRLSIDPTGSYAIAWFDLRKATEEAGGLGGVGAIGSFQDVTLIRLAQDNEHSVDLTVGFRPRKIEFNAAGTRAFVVTDDGISVLDLAEMVDAGPAIVAPIPLASELGTDPLDMEVNVVASGRYAVVRELGQDSIRVVLLEGASAGTMSILELSAQPTDVDLAADGSMAYLVLRDSSELGLLSLGETLPESDDLEILSIEGQTIGSMEVSPAGDVAVLYTNASDVESITLVDLAGAEHLTETYLLQKSIRSLGFDPSGQTLLITHAKKFGDPFDSNILFAEFIDRSYGYSVFDVATGFDKLQITPNDPGQFSFSTNTPRAYVLLDGGDGPNAVAETHVIELDTGVVRIQTMSSPPESVGILPTAGVAFINQRHALGRVSFVNVVTDAMRTVTGFDLNSRIVD